jgi:hypothetical protein
VFGVRQSEGSEPSPDGSSDAGTLDPTGCLLCPRSVGDHDPCERGVREGLRLFSTYDTPHGRIWIITESDRSSTTILLPHEY